MTMFRRGDFTFASGKKGKVKIEVPEGATAEDWESWAFIISQNYVFGSVEGVPTGGLPLAAALQKYVSEYYPLHLIVDDVFTTGRSIRKLITQRRSELEDHHDIRGIVIYHRSGESDPLPSDIAAMWRNGLIIP